MKKTKKEFIGKIVSIKATKTVIVGVVVVTRHPIYKKATKKIRRFPAHNESLILVVGDMVKIAETRPVSKTKHFVVVSKTE